MHGIKLSFKTDCTNSQSSKKKEFDSSLCGSCVRIQIDEIFSSVFENRENGENKANIK